MDKRGEGRLTALYVFIGLALIVGAFIPALIGAFEDTTMPNTESGVYGLISFFTESHSFSLLWVGPEVETNVILWLPDSAESYLISSFNAFTYLPDVLSIPLMILMALSLLYVVITLIPTVGG